MDYEIEVKNVSPQPVVSIRTKCKPGAIKETLSDLLPSSFTHVMARGKHPAGPPFTRFHRFTPEEVELEGGCPVTEHVDGDGRVEAGELPGGEVAATVHVGPYETLSEAYAALEEWVKLNGRRQKGAPWEVYWSDPGQETDPGRWKTEILMPIE
jgi:effector-binding domain-containing protein